MGPHFNERQYEFAVSFEITSALQALIVGGLPSIPTTIEEAKKGYDAVFNLGSGYLYHLQYKVSSFASRRTPNNAARWAYHQRKGYFVLTLLTNTAGECVQHQRLAHLRQREPGVYYCAPRFYKEDEFWTHAANSSVFSNSVFLDVADLGLPTLQGPHSITYDDTGLIGIWSESSEGSRRDRSPAVRRQQDRRELNRETFQRLLTVLVDALAEEGSVAGRIPQDDPEAGLRSSIVAARAPRDSPREMPRRTWRDESEAGLEFSRIPEEDDRERASQLMAELDEPQLLAATANVAALDFGLSTIVEPS